VLVPSGHDPVKFTRLRRIRKRSVAVATHPLLQLEDLPLGLAMQGTNPPRGARDTRCSGSSPTTKSVRPDLPDSNGVVTSDSR
jgi:hypothetical protein